MPAAPTAAKKQTGSTRARKFDRAAYEKELIAAGFEPADAAMIAEKTEKVATDNRRKHRLESASEARAIGSLFDKVGVPLLSERGTPKTARAKKTATEKPATPAKKRAQIERPIKHVIDYRSDEIPAKVRDLIETHLAIEAEDAKSAGRLGFMTRSLAIATLPHRRLDTYRFQRRNGDFTLTMMTAHPQGLPFGTIPRLLLTWVCTEVVQTKEPVLFLGARLANYLAELGLHNSGGERGDITRLKHAMTTLFSSIISCHYEGKDSWALENVLLAERANWWQPQNADEAGSWQSRVQLSQPFFKECLEHPLPVDLRALGVLRKSPLELDIYFWLTHRMSYLSRRSTIPWEALSGQFGSSYANTDQGLRDFRRAFIRALKNVHTIYPEAVIGATDRGLVLHPSPPHVAKLTKLSKHSQQPLLPFGS